MTNPIAPADAEVNGSETILFVDDEPSIRKLGQTILERHGYTVMQARDGREALEIFRRDRNRIHLAILDLNLPQQSGQEVSQEIRSIAPRMKIIISTGQDVTGTPEERERLGADCVIPKPYSPADLLRTVRTILDTCAPS